MKTRDDDTTFDQLVEEATQRILLGLIERGGPGLKSAVHMSLSQAIQWRQNEIMKDLKRRKSE